MKKIIDYDWSISYTYKIYYIILHCKWPITVLCAIIIFRFFYRDGLIAVEEACEAISVFVDDLWKLGGPVYTEERMKSFLDVIGNEVVQLIQNYLDAVCQL